MQIVVKRSLLVGMIPKRQVARAEENSLGSPHNGNCSFPSGHICRCPNKSVENNPPMRTNIYFPMNFKLTSVVE